MPFNSLEVSPDCTSRNTHLKDYIPELWSLLNGSQENYFKRLQLCTRF